MTLDEIRILLVQIDPEIKHGWTMGNGKPYTWWEQTTRTGLMADDRHVEKGWVIYVHRFYLEDTDPIAEALFDALEALPNVSVSQEDSIEEDTGYTHVVIRCEVV